MAKKSFFERLTGATKEEILKTQSQNEEKPLKNDDLEKPQKNPTKTKVTAKKSSSQSTILQSDKATTDKKAAEDKEKWPPEEEGQLTIDVYQTENDIVIKSTIAGVKPEDVDVSISNDMITIKGARREDDSVSQENYYYQELYWGPFSRSIILPVDVDTDKTKASMKNGILTIKLPKIEKVKTKTIRVKELEG